MKLPRFLRRKPKFSLKSEEITEVDKSNIEYFATSQWHNSVVKSLRNRMIDREENVIRWVKEGNVQQALVFASQMEELEDIILEWANIREDIGKKLIETQENAKD